MLDLQGRLVARIAGGARGPGPVRESWRGTAADGRPAPSGLYMVALTTPAGRSVARIVLAR